MEDHRIEKRQFDALHPRISREDIEGRYASKTQSKLEQTVTRAAEHVVERTTNSVSDAKRRVVFNTDQLYKDYTSYVEESFMESENPTMKTTSKGNFEFDLK